jgi:hypothetical protein
MKCSVLTETAMDWLKSLQVGFSSLNKPVIAEEALACARASFRGYLLQD